MKYRFWRVATKVYHRLRNWSAALFDIFDKRLNHAIDKAISEDSKYKDKHDYIL